MAVLFATTVAQAAEAEAPAPGANQVEEVIVTARRVEENLQDVPSSVSAVTGEMLAERSIKDLADIQKVAPNLFLQPAAAEPNSLTLAIRGQKQNDILMTLDASVAVYVDGMNLPRVLGLRGNLVDISRVEVLRGPQGTLYGRNSTGGALSLYTNDPTDAYGASVEARYGNYDAWNVVGIANIPITEGLSLRLVGQRGQHDGYGHDGLGRELADESSTFLRGKLKAELGEKVTAVLSANYQRNRSGGHIFKLAGLAPSPIPGVQGLPATAEAALETGAINTLQFLALTQPATYCRLVGGCPPASPGAAAAAAVTGLASATARLASLVGGDPYASGGTFRQFAHFKSASVSLDVRAELTEDISLRSISGYQEIDRSTAEDLDGSPFEILHPVLFAHDKFVSQELQLLGGDERFNWVAGAFFSYEDGTDGSTTVALARLNPTNPNQQFGAVTNVSRAVFGQANWQFAPKWTLSLGARYSSDKRKLESRNANATGCTVPAPGVTDTPPGASQCPRVFSDTFSDPSWLASLSYRPSDDILLYSKVARGYRTGGQNLRGSNNILTFGSFEPEKVTEYEAGLKSYLLDGRLRLNLAAYYDDYQNIQRSVIVPAASGAAVTIVTNAAKGKIKGIEAEAVFRPTSQFSLTATAGLTDAKYDKFADLTGDRTHETFGVPKWTAGVSARYEIPLSAGELAFQLDYNWQDKVVLGPDAPNPEQVTQKSYGLLNGRISLKLDRWDAEVAVFGKNLTDEEYATGAVSLQRSLGFNNLIIGEPRTYGIEFRKRFGGI
jgi:iron complex outermembrane receptor protein